MNKLYALKSSLIGCALLGAVTANAQMVGADVFLKGHYVEVGIGNLGFYGSAGTAPAGYHPHLVGSTSPLGFVADPNMTGWDTSTVSPITHYMGDYFLPGAPVEGWELQFDSTRCHAYNSGGTTAFTCSDPSLSSVATGSNTSYTTSGSQVIGTWNGIVDSIGVTQVTTLDTNDFYFTVKVTLTNMSSAPIDNIYYIRTLDPDNDETWPGGNFSTNNQITYQMPDTMHASVVTATGVSTPTSIMALGTADSNSTAIVYTTWPIDIHQDLSSLYSHSYTTGAWYDTTNHYGDYAVGIVIKVPHLASVDSSADSVARTTSTTTMHPANTASFTYFYAFTASAIDSAIAATSPYSSVTAPRLTVTNVNAVADINVYPNPSKNVLNVTGLNTTDNLVLYDMMGRTVAQNWTVSAHSINSFSVSNLQIGAYILVVTDANGNVRSRIPVQKQ